MAPIDRARTPESSQPLADYFFIAGVDSQQLLDAYKASARWSYDEYEAFHTGSDRAAGETIQEDVDAEQESAPSFSSPLQSPRSMPPSAAKHSRKDSYQRLSQLSDQARDTVLALEGGRNVHSNRSSATIRPVPSAGPRNSVFISDADFDNAMQKFASDRESFFLDLNFSSSTTTKPSGLRNRPKTQRIVPEDYDPTPNRSFGSVRRHMSFKEMSSTRRQPSVARKGM